MMIEGHSVKRQYPELTEACSKKQRRHGRSITLPPEIWSHIFSHCDEKTAMSLTGVCRLFCQLTVAKVRQKHLAASKRLCCDLRSKKVDDFIQRIQKAESLCALRKAAVDITALFDSHSFCNPSSAHHKFWHPYYLVRDSRPPCLKKAVAFFRLGLFDEGERVLNQISSTCETKRLLVEACTLRGDLDQAVSLYLGEENMSLPPSLFILLMNKGRENLALYLLEKRGNHKACWHALIESSASFLQLAKVSAWLGNRSEYYAVKLDLQRAKLGDFSAFDMRHHMFTFEELRDVAVIASQLNQPAQAARALFIALIRKSGFIDINDQLLWPVVTHFITHKNFETALLFLALLSNKDKSAPFVRHRCILKGRKEIDFRLNQGCIDDAFRLHDLFSYWDLAPFHEETVKESVQKILRSFLLAHQSVKGKRLASHIQDPRGREAATACYGNIEFIDDDPSCDHSISDSDHLSYKAVEYARKGLFPDAIAALIKITRYEERERAVADVVELMNGKVPGDVASSVSRLIRRHFVQAMSE